MRQLTFLLHTTSMLLKWETPQDGRNLTTSQETRIQRTAPIKAISSEINFSVKKTGTINACQNQELPDKEYTY